MTFKKLCCCVAAGAGAVLLVLAGLVAVVEAVAFDRGFYQTEYKKLESAAYVGVSDAVLDEATDTLLAYLEGARENLDLAVTVDGETVEYYTEREKQHMVDVAVLNQNAVRFLYVALPVGAALILLATVLLKNGRAIWRACYYGILATLGFFGVLCAWAAVDFTSFWVQFHHIFFSNELWMLDPATSRMIRMFEQTFFFDMVGKILAVFLSVVAAALVVTGIAHKKAGIRCKT